MAYTVVIHITNEDPIVGEIDELPAAGDNILTVHNPRRRDGKDVNYLSNDVVTVIWPISQVSFVEIIPTEGEERIIGFVRE
jgi:hypothetical protein